MNYCLHRKLLLICRDTSPVCTPSAHDIIIGVGNCFLPVLTRHQSARQERVHDRSASAPRHTCK